MGVKVSEIIKKIEKKFPKGNAESWDNVGLLVGDSKAEVKKIQFSLDATERVVDEAIKNDVDMIITHHPMIFSPMKMINTDSTLGRKVVKLIKNDIALYSIHTNLDSSNGGLNQYVCEKLGWEDSKILDEVYYDLYKMTVYSPTESYNEIINVIEKSKLELNGYEGVSYSTDVIERYKNIEEANKNIVHSKRVDIIGEKGKLHEILGKIKRVHPYDEVAYEIIKIENKYSKNGIGRVVKLDEKVSIEDMIAKVKSGLGIDTLKVVTDNKDKLVKNIAIVNGSGMSFVKKLKRLNIDLFLTGDVKYHEAVDALEEGLNLFDIGHYESEHFFYELLVKEVEGLDVESVVYNEKPVFNYL